MDPGTNGGDNGEDDKARIGFMVGLLLAVGAAVIAVAILRNPKK